MGIIRIEVRGSFGSKEASFTAQEHGHAHCINKAIIWLCGLMREAINNDHQCHEEGTKPDKGFTIE